ESRGNKEKIEEIFKGEVPPAFNWRDFSVIRIPYEICPEDFMDDKTVARASATMTQSNFFREYGCIFVQDSDGFFRRTLIEKCVTSDDNPVRGQVFDPVVRGNPKKKYIYGVDPAIQTDNFAIVILELDHDHWKVVYCWTTNKKDFRARHKIGQKIEHDYYSFCARKIRNLMKTFPCIRIGMDAQGGGDRKSTRLNSSHV